MKISYSDVAVGLTFSKAYVLHLVGSVQLQVESKESCWDGKETNKNSNNGGSHYTEWLVWMACKLKESKNKAWNETTI